MNLRTHKRRADAGMARREAQAAAYGLRHGPACHTFRVVLMWSITGTQPWNPPKRRLFLADWCDTDHTRAVPRGSERRG